MPSLTLQPLIFSNKTCYFVANPTNWFTIITVTSTLKRSKNLKCISNSLLDQTLPLAFKLHMYNLNLTYFNYKMLDKMSVLKNWDLKSEKSKFHSAFFWLVLAWPLKKQDIFRQFSDSFIFKNFDWFLWIYISNTQKALFNFYNYCCQIHRLLHVKSLMSFLFTSF